MRGKAVEREGGREGRKALYSRNPSVWKADRLQISLVGVGGNDHLLLIGMKQGQSDEPDPCAMLTALSTHHRSPPQVSSSDF